MIAGSRALARDAWLPAYLESPVWRFALPPGMCGDLAVLGLMLPSVDKAGRYFPLSFAALHPHGIAVGSGDAWLDACETAGREALEQDTEPQEIVGMLGVPDASDVTVAMLDAVWWSDGSERVPSARMTLRSLPDVATYAAMLGADARGDSTWEPTS